MDDAAAGATLPPLPKKRGDMSDEWDGELRQAPEGEPALPARPPRRWIAVVLVVVAAGVAVYFVGRRTAPFDTTVQPGAAADRAADKPAPLGAEPERVDVPALDQSDSLVRELVRKLSSHPEIARWLATDGLIRNFTVVVENVADGMSPVTHLGGLRPSQGFAVVERGEDLAIDPRSYQRYDRLADAFASLDPAGSARLYSTLKPRIEEAHRDLGSPDPAFDRTLERAVVHLLEVPVAGESPAVEPQGIGYSFADPRLQSLTASQKHLLRMGPRNVRIVQRTLRSLALALGIPAERLPALR
jgi:Protein of unknown function (DUF3014)